MGSGASSNKMGRGPKNLSLKPRQRKAGVTYTAVVPFDDAKATLEAEEILESYRSFEDTDPGDKDGPPLPPGRLEHDSHLRRMEMFQHQVEKDPMEFLERVGL